MKTLFESRSIPSNYEEHLEELTSQGYRVLAVSYKLVDLEGLPPKVEKFEPLETGSTFLGFIILENKLKAKSRETMIELINNDIHCCIVSGDNINTTTSIAV